MARAGVLAAAAALAVALWPAATLAQAAPALAAAAADQVLDLRSGRATTPELVLAELRLADVVLLGELHDNPQHHARRAALLAALRGSGAVVVAEQLTAGRRLASGDAPLLQRLTAAGFEPAPWGWPLHQPLFAAVDQAGLPLLGGNLARDSARQVVRGGLAALSGQPGLGDLPTLLLSVPLPAGAQAALDDDLLRGHCGQLSVDRLPSMRSAQRARDAAMWRALATSGGRPAVLLAGNGHVRLDYGVAQIALALSPGLRVLSVEFAELGEALATGDQTGSTQPVFTHRWLTPPAQRADPCEGMLARPAPAAAVAAGVAASAPAAR